MVGPSKTDDTRENQLPRGPANCESRGRAEDAADVVREMASTMREFEPDLVKRLVIARNAATGIHAAFPEGDKRFDDSDNDADDDDDDGEGVQDEYGDEGLDCGDDGGEQCHGLLDTIMDRGPLECLRRAKEDHGFDLIAEMDAVGLDFFERIRVANFIRKEIRDGQEANDVVKRTRSTLQARHDSILKDNTLLEPVLEDDLLLTVLESQQQMEAEQGSEERDVSDAIESSLRAENILP